MKLDFEKMGGLIPAIIQDSYTQKVLMLGFMNEEAYNKTIETGKCRFLCGIPVLQGQPVSTACRCRNRL